VDEIRRIDYEGHQVVNLVLEVTRQPGETKANYLERVLTRGSRQAQVLKCADRISNLTDLHRDTHSNQKISSYLHQTKKYVLPMAKKVNQNMFLELNDLVKKRLEILQATEQEKQNK